MEIAPGHADDLPDPVAHFAILERLPDDSVPLLFSLEYEEPYCGAGLPQTVLLPAGDVVDQELPIGLGPHRGEKIVADEYFGLDGAKFQEDLLASMPGKDRMILKAGGVAGRHHFDWMLQAVLTHVVFECRVLVLPVSAKVFDLVGMRIQVRESQSVKL